MQFNETDAVVDFLLGQIPGTLRVGAPLGLGKPNVLLNRLYERMKADPRRELEIYTALSLDPPQAKGLLAQRFLTPFSERHFGAYPRLQYVKDLLAGQVPPHIRIHEFYLQAGLLKNESVTQQNYISLNYTHAGQTLLDRGLNVIVQLVSRGPSGKLSLSCNPDLTLDLHDLARARQRKILLVAVVHPDLPYLGGDAEVGHDFFDAILDEPKISHELFALPRQPVDPASHLIGLYASQCLLDDGTLQIGIGSLAEALTYALLLRQQKNALYRRLTSRLTQDRMDLSPLSQTPFTKGIYGTSEMVMDSFMHLREAGILKRRVKDQGAETYLHGGFFLGSKPFYAWLRSLKGEDLAGLRMTRISKVNDLYDPDEMALRRQRKNARFFNTCMQVTLFGGAISDTLPDGRVVSGVGGQYNFVAMAHELPDAISVLMLKSTRTEKGKRHSNIVFEGGHLTIPRHLRDVVITEYGIAQLRGKSDEECVRALLAVADSEFQGELVERAQRAGKLSRDFRVPEHFRHNNPTRLKDFLREARREEGGLFPPYPFGNDFTPEEERLADALAQLKEAPATQMLEFLWHGTATSRWKKEMRRMGLEQVRGVKERFLRRLLVGSLELLGHEKKLLSEHPPGERNP